MTLLLLSSSILAVLSIFNAVAAVRHSRRLKANSLSSGDEREQGSVAFMG